MNGFQLRIEVLKNFQEFKLVLVEGKLLIFYFTPELFPVKVLI